jgi:AcrR family transcriptional regulator
MLQKGASCFLEKTSKNTQNVIARESIFTALMILMGKKKFNEISISELTKKAGVSRMAYYRNYKMKEDIIVSYLDELFEEFVTEITNYKNKDKYQIGCLYFSYFRRHGDLIKNLIHSNLTYLILERYDRYVDVLFRNASDDNKLLLEDDKYIIGYTAGGLYKVLIEWVKSGMKESDEEMAKIQSSLLSPVV